MLAVRVDIPKKPKRRILRNLQKHIFQKFSWTNRTVGKEGPGGGKGLAPGKNFFHLKSENIKSLYVMNIWNFGLFIEQDISDKK